jgi:transcriptional/translational regulatory protein YebC/TACO1
MSELDAKIKKQTYDAPIRAKFKLKNKTTGEEKTQELFEALDENDAVQNIYLNIKN